MADVFIPSPAQSELMRELIRIQAESAAYAEQYKAAINPYPSDVKAMSDEELSRLSEELSDAYLCTNRDDEWGDDESYWTDDAAEARYYEMRHEISRRWREANPEKAAQMDVIAKSSISMLMNQLDLTRHIAVGFNAAGALKVGQTTKVRMPVRYAATDGSIQ